MRTLAPVVPILFLLCASQAPTLAGPAALRGLDRVKVSVSVAYDGGDRALEQQAEALQKRLLEIRLLEDLTLPVVDGDADEKSPVLFLELETAKTDDGSRHAFMGRLTMWEMVRIRRGSTPVVLSSTWAEFDFGISKRESMSINISSCVEELLRRFIADYRSVN